MNDIEARLRALEIAFTELRTQYDGQSKLLKAAVVLIAAHFGIDLQAAM